MSEVTIIKPQRPSDPGDRAEAEAALRALIVALARSRAEVDHGAVMTRIETPR